MSNTSEAFVASVARALKLEQIPCVLWGHYLLSTHGVPTILGVSIAVDRGGPRPYANFIQVD